MRFHYPGMSFTQTTREYSACAFTTKIRLLCKMLTEMGHTVYHYGTEGSDPICTENVTVLSLEDMYKTHPKDKWRKAGFNTTIDNEAFQIFKWNTVAEISKRYEPRDFILCPLGAFHMGIAAEFKDAIVVEPGIGYPNSFAEHRVWESYAWMHFNYGLEKRVCAPKHYDAAIPNYFDLNDYTFRPDKEDYFFWIGRPTPLKGLHVAADVCKEIGAKLYAAGQGKPPAGLDVEHIGVVSIEERDRWMGGAKGLFCPTLYIEPFGCIAVEAMLCGTPVISTDFGAFPETVIHGKTGFRCRTHEQFVWAAKNIDKIDPKDCRYHAAQNYSLEKIGPMYDEYFTTLRALYTPEGWYSKRENRTELDWLRKWAV